MSPWREVLAAAPSLLLLGSSALGAERSLAPAALEAPAPLTAPAIPAMPPEAVLPAQPLPPAGVAEPSAADAAAALPPQAGSPFLSSYAEPAAPEPIRHQDYTEPNELSPEQAQAIFDGARPGLYVTVGTERGFIMAALARSTHLLLADHDPRVAAYNRANVALLRLARDREDYVRLRRSTAEQVRAHESFSRLDAQDRAALAADFDLFARYQPESLLYRGGFFEKSNYLKDDALFARVKALADARRIKVARVDLRDAAAVASLAAAVAASDAPLSVLDVSNGWLDHYIGTDGVAAMVKAFASSAHEDSLLLVTRRRPGGWFYWGFKPYRRASNALEAADAARLIRKLSNYTPNRLNGLQPPPWPRRLLNLTMSALR